MGKKKTAIELLDILLLGVISFDSEVLRSKYKEALTQAKAMEKEQIINSFDEGKSDGYKTAREWDEMIVWLSAEQYYTSTYGK